VDPGPAAYLKNNKTKKERIMELKNLKDLYIHELQDLYSAENQILEALPLMEEATDDPQLKKAFSGHRRMTEQQKERLEKIFGMLNLAPNGKKCEGMKGIIQEGQSLVKKDKKVFGSEIDKDVLNAGLIAGAQKVEHYEIAGYGTATAFAKRLGFSDHASLLHQTLQEEVETDRQLTQLAESSINLEAQK
jgi:ferritin-like metal-binding protein YciE